MNFFAQLHFVNIAWRKITVLPGKIWRGKQRFETSRNALVLIALTETISVWSEGTQQNHYVFLLRALLAPVKLSWSLATYPRGSRWCCLQDICRRTSQTRPTWESAGRSSPQSKHASLDHIKEHSVMPNAASQATSRDKASRSSVLNPGCLLMPPHAHFSTSLESSSTSTAMK